MGVRVRGVVVDHALRMGGGKFKAQTREIDLLNEELHALKLRGSSNKICGLSKIKCSHKPPKNLTFIIFIYQRDGFFP